MRTQRIGCDEHGSHLWWICLCGVTIPKGFENGNE